MNDLCACVQKRIAISSPIGYNPTIQYQPIVKAVKVTVLQSVQRYSCLWTLFCIYSPAGQSLGRLKVSLFILEERGGMKS